MKYMMFARLFMEFFTSSECSDMTNRTWRAHSLELLQNAGVEILIHIPILESIMRGFL